jgi:predicted DNA-binding transcriptional regulator YafY
MLIGAMVVLLSGIGFLQAAEPMSADTAGVLRQALKEKRVVVFTYHGHARTVEPHALGRGVEDRPVLLAWQTAGGSSSEPPPGWRVFLLAEIQTIKPTEVTFVKVRPDYQSHRVGRGLKSVEAEIE